MGLAVYSMWRQLFPIRKSLLGLRAADCHMHTEWTEPVSTNFFLNPKSPCSTCGLTDHRENLHIGKRSAGWRFLFHAYPEKGLITTAAWESYLKEAIDVGGCILDEYDELIPLEKFIALVRDLVMLQTRSDKYISTSDGVADFMAGYFS